MEVNYFHQHNEHRKGGLATKLGINPATKLGKNKVESMWHLGASIERSHVSGSET